MSSLVRLVVFRSPAASVGPPGSYSFRLRRSDCSQVTDGAAAVVLATPRYAEAWAANQLIAEGKIQPILSAVYPLDDTGEAAYQVHKNLHEGKIGVLCLAPEEGLGIDDPEFREQVGEDKINVFRRLGA